MSTGFQYNKGPLMLGASPRDFSLSTHEFGVHDSETTQRFVYGTRYITWDGKVYKYSLAGASCYTLRLNAFWNTISSDVNGIDYSVLTYNQSIGDREITLTNGTTAVAEDYLAGGLAVIVPSETYTDGEVMLRGIIGNDSAAAAAECTMYLDDPLETAVTTSQYAYAMPSSYSNVRYSSNTGGTRSWAGLAATYTASGSNFWCQTYGPAQCAAQTRAGSTTWYRDLYARYNGTLDIHSQIGTNVADQRVGFILDNNGDANGATNIMLTISF